MQAACAVAGERGAARSANGKVFFPHGLPGLERYRYYRVEPLPGNDLFFMLRSTEEEGLALFLVDPFPFFPGYRVELDESDLFDLETETAADLLIYTTVTVAGAALYTNLAAPIVISAGNRRGKQLILPDRSAELRVPLIRREK
jgi:flagellar assembly factor FliW